ncbi:hypothetical protein LIER_19552 [Lithospermum erythrorhizon]|uniref:Uncharacterized protein n=1 Tax=Lithospermum erythrorhizon TaxID=34254 RepID=A0AAV3QL90_LITER
MTSATNALPYFVTIVLATSEPQDRKELWEGLSHLANDQLPWMFMGDFNYIVDPTESMGSFTWTNGAKFKRLDRVLSNPGCMDSFSNIVIPKHVAGSPRFYKSCCRGLEQPVYGEPIFVLWQKLKRLKATLKKWNKETFGNIFSLVEQAEDEVVRFEHLFEQSNSPTDREALHKAQAEHLRLSFRGGILGTAQWH